MAYKYNPLPPKFDRVDITSVPPSVPTKFTADDGNFAVPALNNLNVFGGVGIDTYIPTPGGDTIRIKVDDAGFVWEEKNTDFSIESQHAYFCNATLTASLPSTGSSTIGDSVIIYVDTTDIVTIQANTGQFIQISSNISASAGTATSNTQGAILELVFKASDSTWHTISSMGTWNVT